MYSCTSLKYLGRFQNSPATLFRIGKSKEVFLREYHDERSKGSYRYDYKINDYGLIVPTEGDEYTGNNGLTLYSSGNKLHML